MTIGVFIYPGMELQDFAGPTDVFVKANRYTDIAYKIFTFSFAQEVIRTERNAVAITADYDFDNLPEVDLIIVPGAPMDVIRTFSKDKKIQAFLNTKKEVGITLASICTGAFFLAEAGLLKDIKYTTHFLRADLLQSELHNAQLVKDVRFVDSGQILTGSGITSGIDLALYIVERFSGKKVQENVAKAMQYNYHIEQKWPQMKE